MMYALPTSVLPAVLRSGWNDPDHVALMREAALRELARACDDARYLGLRLIPAGEHKPWVELCCHCGAELSIPAAPQRPAVAALWVVLFAARHDH